MTAGEAHLAELPENPVMAAAVAGAFNVRGHADLLALQDGIELRALFHPPDLSGDPTMAASWQDAAALRSLSLSLFHGHGHQQAAFAPPPTPPSGHHQLPAQPGFHVRSSKYLAPTKELLGEFCSLGGEHDAMNGKRGRASGGGRWEEVESSSSSSVSWANQALSWMSVLELERSKAKLFSMVEEVDRRYRRYRGQMRSVELSFEAAAGAGAARAYSELAMRAMSRHFRCLRDAIVAQIRAARRERGVAEAAAAAAPGATKGETPRLRVLDQRLRQHRAFRHGGAAADSFPWRPQRGLPERAVAILRAWLFDHFLHPYPSDVDKHLLARQTGLSRSQVSNWFINARVRLWKPMIEDMYTEETKQQHQEQQGCLHPSHGDAQNSNPTSKHAVLHSHDQKPPLPPLPGEEAAGHLPDNSFISAVFDGGHQLAGYTSMPGGGGAVLLTLGLQQHAGGGDGGAPVHLGMLDVGEEEEMLPYRNLMGSHQFLHDDLA